MDEKFLELKDKVAYLSETIGEILDMIKVLTEQQNFILKLIKGE